MGELLDTRSDYFLAASLDKANLDSTHHNTYTRARPTHPPSTCCRPTHHRGNRRSSRASARRSPWETRTAMLRDTRHRASAEKRRGDEQRKPPQKRARQGNVARRFPVANTEKNTTLTLLSPNTHFATPPPHQQFHPSIHPLPVLYSEIWAIHIAPLSFPFSYPLPRGCTHPWRGSDPLFELLLPLLLRRRRL